ncbi:unnamed protein product [Protopolystoma xenopodis]|uniref:Uncharacterized protein n=1 Tax=Protopolystoma xenopodis TaxID=117903 RepID=A0A448XNS9_9PLAT|nr:unnamed protein product [Protopolystoma xenopodis]
MLEIASTHEQHIHAQAHRKLVLTGFSAFLSACNPVKTDTEAVHSPAVIVAPRPPVNSAEGAYRGWYHFSRYHGHYCADSEYDCLILRAPSTRYTPSA